jgi:alginate O-acetyltransferase complex protein AlgI
MFVFDMFMILRFVTYFWQVGSGQVALPSAIRFAAWTSFPFTLFSPVLRLSEFDAQLNGPIAPSASAAERAARWRRGLSGVAVLIAGAALRTLVDPLHAVGKLGTLGVLTVVSPWSFYLQAAGLATVMQALAYSWRFSLPSNFNRPFGRPNISEFWANWNITATSIFRDYLFYNRWGGRRVNLYLNVMVLFVLVGVWHALGAYWIIWGLIHGMTFCIYLWYKKHGAVIKPLFEWRHGRVLGAALTYLAVIAAWALPPQVMKLLAVIP